VEIFKQKFLKKGRKVYAEEEFRKNKYRGLFLAQKYYSSVRKPDVSRNNQRFTGKS
jgi:hypothetical protein